MLNSQKYFKIQNYFLIFLFIYLQIYLNEGMDNRGKNIMEDNGEWSDGEKSPTTNEFKSLENPFKTKKIYHLLFGKPSSKFRFGGMGPSKLRERSPRERGESLLFFSSSSSLLHPSLLLSDLAGRSLRRLGEGGGAPGPSL